MVDNVTISSLFLIVNIFEPISNQWIFSADKNDSITYPSIPYSYLVRTENGKEKDEKWYLGYSSVTLSSHY